ELLATDLADHLVRRAVPFRESHRLVGQAVRRALALGCGLRELSVQAYAEISTVFGDDVREALDFAQSVARHDVIGGTAPSAVVEQIRRAREMLEA
ncbi:MAG: argininosuccinate lyase, partial [Anaerolineae bacterium]|nr:argininosuccinate lyase [Anaerolineae bacterium]